MNEAIVLSAAEVAALPLGTTLYPANGLGHYKIRSSGVYRYILGKKVPVAKLSNRSVKALRLCSYSMITEPVSAEEIDRLIEAGEQV